MWLVCQLLRDVFESLSGILFRMDGPIRIEPQKAELFVTLAAIEKLAGLDRK